MQNYILYLPRFLGGGELLVLSLDLITDFVPGINQAKYLALIASSIKNGEVINAALSGIGLIPGGGALKKLTKASKLIKKSNSGEKVILNEIRELLSKSNKIYKGEISKINEGLIKDLVRRSGGILKALVNESNEINYKRLKDFIDVLIPADREKGKLLTSDIKKIVENLDLNISTYNKSIELDKNVSINLQELFSKVKNIKIPEKSTDINKFIKESLSPQEQKALEKIITFDNETEYIKTVLRNVSRVSGNKVKNKGILTKLEVLELIEKYPNEKYDINKTYILTSRGIIYERTGSQNYHHSAEFSKNIDKLIKYRDDSAWLANHGINSRWLFEHGIGLEENGKKRGLSTNDIIKILSSGKSGFSGDKNNILLDTLDHFRIHSKLNPEDNAKYILRPLASGEKTVIKQVLDSNGDSQYILKGMIKEVEENGKRVMKYFKTKSNEKIGRNEMERLINNSSGQSGKRGRKNIKKQIFEEVESEIEIMSNNHGAKIDLKDDKLKNYAEGEYFFYKQGGILFFKQMKLNNLNNII